MGFATDMQLALIIPTLNAGLHLDKLLPAIQMQTLKPDVLLVVDSGSKDDTVQRFLEIGACVEGIALGDFNHGGTRRLATELVDADVYVFITQDAIFESKETLSELCQIFSKDQTVGATYARQLPHSNADILSAHARLFNYPAESKLKSIADSSALGIKTCFMSDSCAAYRQTTLKKVGGFPEDVIGSEDAYVGAKIILAGEKIYYNSAAKVYHSHNYSLLVEFRRYFDIGVFYGREKWIKEAFGDTNGEGFSYVKSELKVLYESGYYIKIIEVFFRTFLKLSGFKLGCMERFLPLALKRRVGMFSNYWR